VVPGNLEWFLWSRKVPVDEELSLVRYIWYVVTQRGFWWYKIVSGANKVVPVVQSRHRWWRGIWNGLWWFSIVSGDPEWPK